jgi:hypothetical protein
MNSTLPDWVTEALDGAEEANVACMRPLLPFFVAVAEEVAPVLRTEEGFLASELAKRHSGLEGPDWFDSRGEALTLSLATILIGKAFEAHAIEETAEVTGGEPEGSAAIQIRAAVQTFAQERAFRIAFARHLDLAIPFTPPDQEEECDPRPVLQDFIARGEALARSWGE